MAEIEYIVSGCLAGLNCKYNGGSNPCPEVMKLCREGKAIPVCPESLSGLPVPREPSEIINGNVYSKSGNNVTVQFELGAGQALKKALSSGAKKAILKSRSPSCGCGEIYDGSFSGNTCKGNGIFTKKLLAAGFTIYTEESLPEDL